MCNELGAYYQIEGTRGSGVAKALIGNSSKDDVLVRDDYRGYASLEVKHQSCWSHLLRKARDYVSFEDPVKGMAELETELKEIFRDLNEFIESDPTDQIRQIEYNKYICRLDSIIKRKYKKDSYADKIRNRIATQHENLLTAVLIKGVPLTNNLAERDLRPIVINRKLSGGSRSQLGAEITAVNKSIVQTLNKRGIELIKGLEMLINGQSLTEITIMNAEST